MSKKFILFIVEGSNDKIEINAMLHSHFFDQYRSFYEPVFYVVNGDIMLETITIRNKKVKVTSDNIQQALNDVVMDFRRYSGPYNNIAVSDIKEIVQITDMDGAFIPRHNVVRDDDSVYCSYYDNCIKAKNVDGIVGRNKRKSEIIRKLLTVKQIGNIPYSLYYVSCNMDHLLFNERNLDSRDKKPRALRFASLCNNHPEYLSESVFKYQVIEEGSYEESWNLIQKGTNSLGRYTNFNLFFTDKAKNQK